MGPKLVWSEENSKEHRNCSSQEQLIGLRQSVEGQITRLLGQRPVPCQREQSQLTGWRIGSEVPLLSELAGNPHSGAQEKSTHREVPYALELTAQLHKGH